MKMKGTCEDVRLRANNNISSLRIVEVRGGTSKKEKFKERERVCESDEDPA